MARKQLLTRDGAAGIAKLHHHGPNHVHISLHWRHPFHFLNTDLSRSTVLGQCAAVGLQTVF